MLKDFKTRIKIKAEPDDVWAALTNPFTIELWSGYPAEMSEEPGFEFSLWEGDICGVNMDVIQNEKLVQEWFFGEQDQPSIVTLKLFPQGAQTQVELVHTNIPDEAFDDITEGWEKQYLGAIKEFLEADE
jgi:activator of HSP90 ATPase